MLRTKREVQGGNRRKVESQRRERVGGIQEGVQEGKAIKVKEKVRGRGNGTPEGSIGDQRLGRRRGRS